MPSDFANLNTSKKVEDVSGLMCVAVENMNFKCVYFVSSKPSNLKKSCPLI